MPLTWGLGVAYVGSHSHLFLAVEVGSGRVLWRTKLGGRVESSACSSHCGKYIAVGEYASRVRSRHKKTLLINKKNMAN